VTRCCDVMLQAVYTPCCKKAVGLRVISRRRRVFLASHLTDTNNQTVENRESAQGKNTKHLNPVKLFLINKNTTTHSDKPAGIKQLQPGLVSFYDIRHMTMNRVSQKPTRGALLRLRVEWRHSEATVLTLCPEDD